MIGGSRTPFARSGGPYAQVSDQQLLTARRATSTGAGIKALARVRPRHLVPDIPRNAEPRTGLSMGDHAAVTARRRGITREEQDRLAATSHQRLAAAYGRGFLDDLVILKRTAIARDFEKEIEAMYRK